MTIIQFLPQSGERILYHGTPNLKWYAVVWKIFSDLVGIGFLLIRIYALGGDLTQIAFVSFMPAWLANLLIKVLFLGLLPLAGVAWVAEDVACTFMGEYILTNQRIWIRGSPYAWSQTSLSLDNTASLTFHRDAIFVKQKSTKKIRVLMILDSALFVKAYEQFTGKSNTSTPHLMYK